MNHSAMCSPALQPRGRERSRLSSHDENEPRWVVTLVAEQPTSKGSSALVGGKVERFVARIDIGGAFSDRRTLEIGPEVTQEFVLFSLCNVAGRRRARFFEVFSGSGSGRGISAGFPHRARLCESESLDPTLRDVCLIRGIGCPSGSYCAHLNQVKNRTVGRARWIPRLISAGPPESIGNSRPCTEPCAPVCTHQARRG